MLIIKKKKLFVGRNSRDEQFCFNFLVVLIYFQLHLNLFIPTYKSYDLDKKKQVTFQRPYLGQISTDFKKLHEVWKRKRIPYNPSNLRLCATL